MPQRNLPGGSRPTFSLLPLRTSARRTGVALAAAGFLVLVPSGAALACHHPSPPPYPTPTSPLPTPPPTSPVTVPTTTVTAPASTVTVASTTTVTKSVEAESTAATCSSGSSGTSGKVCGVVSGQANFTG